MCFIAVVGFATMANAQCADPVPAPAGSLFNWQFDGGLDGWTATNAAGEAVTNMTTTPTSAEGPIFGWVWDADGTVCGGAYNACDAANDFIVSPSVCNGSMVFNSDFYDNEGIAGNFGVGVCPPDCIGMLNSPVMDLSNSGEVAVQFNQGVRQFQSTFQILLSRDAGMTFFDTLTVNGDLPVNSPHVLTDQQTVPLCGLGGEAEASITFLYTGNYYYWAIDDVAIMPAPTADMRVNSNFAAISPTFGQPHNMPFDIPFLADIENIGAVTGVAPVLTATVSDANGTIIMSQQRTYDDVPGCRTDENKPFAELMTLPNGGQDEVGTYTVAYEVNTAGDTNAENDVVSGEFQITANKFKKMITEEEAGAEYIDGWRPGGTSNFKSWGSYFYMPHNDLGQAIEEVRTGIVFAANATPNSGNLIIAVYQWVDANGDGIVNSGNDEEKIKLGQTEVLVLPGGTGYRDIRVTPLDDDGELIVPQVDPSNPDEGIQLLVMLHTDPFSTDINYFALGILDGDDVSYSTRASTLAYDEIGITPRYGSFQANGTDASDADNGRDYEQSGVNYYMNAVMTPIEDAAGNVVSTTDINDALDVNVYPSPASRFMNVDMNFPTTAETVVVDLINIAGSTVGHFTYQNVKETTVSLDVSNFPGGIYTMNIMTSLGQTTKKVSIVH